MNRKILLTVLLSAATIALFRVLPKWEGVWGITPLFSIALFSGAVFRNKKGVAFLFPVLALFFSDVLWLLTTEVQGFYKGQLVNYLLFVLMTCLGFLIKKINVVNVAVASLAAPTVFFVLSNFAVWAGGGGLARPKTFAGLMQTYAGGVPFYYPWQLISTLAFSVLLFGGMYLLLNEKTHKASRAL